MTNETTETTETTGDLVAHVAKELHERFAPDHEPHWHELDEDEQRNSEVYDMAQALGEANLIRWPTAAEGSMTTAREAKAALLREMAADYSDHGYASITFTPDQLEDMADDLRADDQLIEDPAALRSRVEVETREALARAIREQQPRDEDPAPGAVLVFEAFKDLFATTVESAPLPAAAAGTLVEVMASAEGEPQAYMLRRPDGTVEAHDVAQCSEQETYADGVHWPVVTVDRGQPRVERTLIRRHDVWLLAPLPAAEAGRTD